MNDVSGGGRRQVSSERIAEVLGLPRPTDEQRAVIEAPVDAQLVVAGAGSGKTETMASRVVWLVANRLARPDEVLGLTFTRKAARELSERLNRRLTGLAEAGLFDPTGPDDEEDHEAGSGQGSAAARGEPTVMTYNAFAGQLVRDHGLRLGIEPDATLLTEAACWQVAEDVVRRADPGFADLAHAPATLVDAVLSLSGELNEHLVDPVTAQRYLDELADRLEALPAAEGKRVLKVGVDTAAAMRERARIYPLVQEYRHRLAERGATDFSAQIAAAAALAQQVPGVGRIERARVRAVLLDEFQDTSDAQLTLLTALFRPSERADGAADASDGARRLAVTAVGDPNQSIYGWRGASATTLVRFAEQFSRPDRPVPVVSLSISWRNDAAILDAANRLADPLRAASKVAVPSLRPAPSNGPSAGDVEVARLLTEADEAEYVADWVRQVRGAAPEADRDLRPTIAVLCRARRQFAPVMAALHRAGIPVEVVGVGGLLATPEVADLVALLDVVQEPTRGPQLMRLLTGPMVRLGAADLDVLWSWAQRLAAEVTRRGRSTSSAEGSDPGSDDAAAVAAQGGDVAAERLDTVLADAVENPPPPGWLDSHGRGLSEVARQRVLRLGAAIDDVRALTGLALPDLLQVAERALDLDIEVASDPDRQPIWARAQLDRFADIAEHFLATSDQPSLDAFLSWLRAAARRERGLEPAPVEPSRDAVQVLTVHAAKGLEWDAVAVPGLVDGAFPSRDGRVNPRDEPEGWEFSAYAVKGWLTGLGSLPYPLRGDADGLPQVDWTGIGDTHALREQITRVGAEGIAHATAEERRLAYVATTRARHRLLLSAAVWGEATSPRVSSPYLLEVADITEGETTGPRAPEVWEPMPPTKDREGAAPSNPAHDADRSANWPREPEPARLEAAEVVAARVEAAQVGERSGSALADLDPELDERLRLLLAERQEWERRGDEVPGGRPLVEHLSASGLVALAADPGAFVRRRRRPMPTEPSDAARRGTSFHTWVQQHYGAATLIDPDEVRLDQEDSAGGGGSAGARDVPSGVDGVGAATTGESNGQPPRTQDIEFEWRRTFAASEWAQRIPSALELDIETVIGAVPLRCRIDAVFPLPGGGEVIVDWKTGAKPNGERARLAALQLSAYRVAYCRLTGADPSAVEGAFFYASTGTTLRPSLIDEDELVAMITELTYATPVDSDPPDQRDR